MSKLDAKCRASFDEWLKSIPEHDLEHFVFSEATKTVDFGSDDFKLINHGLSTGEPAGCYMIEACVNGKTKDKKLSRLFRTSGSVANSPTRLAFALFPKSMDGHCLGRHVKQALAESRVKGQSTINKVHVQWSPAVTFLENGKPRFAAGVVPLVFEKVPFDKFNVDGSKAKKKANGKK